MHKIAENKLLIFFVAVLGTFATVGSFYFSYVQYHKNATPPPTQQSPLTQPPTAIDITNSELMVDGFLDINGTQEKSTDFLISKKCRIEIFWPKGTGFTVGYKILSDSGSKIIASPLGTQPHERSLDLPAGKYTFVLKALRGARYYSAQLKTHCE